MLGSFITITSSRKEKAMAAHSSTLAWEIPWTEEPGRLQSVGSRRVGHDWVTSLSLFTFMHWRRKWQPNPVFLPGESQGREPARLPSMGSHGVGHDWYDLAVAAAVAVPGKSHPCWTESMYIVIIFWHCLSATKWILETQDHSYIFHVVPPVPTVESVQFSRSVISDSATPWTAAHLAALSITNFWCLLNLMSIELVMPSNHHPLPCPSPPTFNLSQH